MSVKSLSVLAAARVSADPTKVTAGVKQDGAKNAADPPSLPEILVKSVPTELVAPYTAFITVVDQFVKKATPGNPIPDQYLPARWIGFAILVIGTGAYIYISYKGQHTHPGFPIAAEISALTAAAAWGLALPSSPLLAAIHNKAEGSVAIATIAFAAAVISILAAIKLKSKPST